MGAIWTYRVFQQTRQTSEAEERLTNERLAAEKTRADLEHERRTQESKRAIVPAMELSQLSTRPRIVAVRLKFTNGGDAEQRLGLKDAVFEIRKVLRVAAKGDSTLGPARPFMFDLGDQFVSAVMLPGGQEMQLDAIQEVPSAGVYCVRFSVPDPKVPKASYDLVQYISVR